MRKLDVPGNSRLLSWLPAAMAFVYLGTTSVLAIRKLMWNDELLTFYTALRPSDSGLWSALLTGSQQIPPLFFYITRLSMDLFGQLRSLTQGVGNERMCTVEFFDYRGYLRLREPFLIHCHNPEWSWLLAALMDDGRKLDLISRNGEEVLYRLQPE